MSFKTYTSLLLGLSTLSFVLAYHGLIPWQVAVSLPLIAGLLLIALAAFNIQWNFFLKAIHRENTATRQIALTFDDGPHPTYTPQVLALLEKYGIKATFFCIGKHILQHPELVKKLYDRGHVVANHTFTHAPTIDFHSKAKWLSELRQTDEAIANTVGRKPVFFRPPYGVTTPHLAKAIWETGHTVVGWRVRPYDTLRRPPQQLINTILKQTKPGDIILLHDTHQRIVPVLEQLLPQLKQRGFEMVTVEKLIQRHAYTSI